MFWEVRVPCISDKDQLILGSSGALFLEITVDMFWEVHEPSFSGKVQLILGSSHAPFFINYS